MIGQETMPLIKRWLNEYADHLQSEEHSQIIECILIKDEQFWIDYLTETHFSFGVEQ